MKPLVESVAPDLWLLSSAGNGASDTGGSATKTVQIYIFIFHDRKWIFFVIGCKNNYILPVFCNEQRGQTGILSLFTETVKFAESSKI